jgi:hypothetical protein
MNAYTDDRIYSIDLVGAVRLRLYHSTPKLSLAWQVIRQGSFVHKMHGLHWTKPDFFASREGEIALQHAIARYHAYVLQSYRYRVHAKKSYSFLDLMSTSPRSFFVPTLDIDLVWHTHQLMAHKYENDCRSFVGRFIDQ